MTQQKIWNKTFILICFLGTMSCLGMSMAETVIGRYATSLGATVSIVGNIASAVSITALAATPLSAPLIDALKKNWIFAVSSAIVGASFIGYCFSTNITMMFVFRLLNGVGKGVWGASCLAMASDSLPESKMSSGIAYFAMLQSVATAIGPTLGLKLSETFGYGVNFFAAAAMLIATAIIAVMLKMSNGQVKRIQINLSNCIAVEALAPAFIMMLLSTAYSTINSFLVVYADTFHVSNIGYFFTVYSMVLLVSRPIVARMTEKYPVIHVVIPALVCFGASMVIVSYARSFPVFILASVISAFGYGALQPLVQSLCLKCVDKDRRGVGSTTSYIGTNLGYLIGPLVGGLIAENYGYEIMFRTTCICLVMAFITFILSRKKFA